MKNTLKYLIGFALLLCFMAVPSLAQSGTALNMTTLSAAITNTTNTFGIASATGVTVPQNTYNTDLYIGRELMTVIAVNSTTVTVIRGVGGSQAAAHPSGDMVLIGPPQAFPDFDPEGTCSGTGATNPVQYTPWVNLRTGNQWLCSTITKTWVPGFSNFTAERVVTTLVADAASAVLPSGPLFEMGGGTNAVTGFTIPVGCNATAVGGCSITVIPTTAWTWTTGGNFAVAGTAVAFTPITFIWDATTSKWEVTAPS